MCFNCAKLEALQRLQSDNASVESVCKEVACRVFGNILSESAVCLKASELREELLSDCAKAAVEYVKALRVLSRNDTAFEALLSHAESMQGLARELILKDEEQDEAKDMVGQLLEIALGGKIMDEDAVH